MLHAAPLSIWKNKCLRSVENKVISEVEQEDKHFILFNLVQQLINPKYKLEYVV